MAPIEAVVGRDAPTSVASSSSPRACQRPPFLEPLIFPFCSQRPAVEWAATRAATDEVYKDSSNSSNAAVGLGGCNQPAFPHCPTHRLGCRCFRSAETPVVNENSQCRRWSAVRQSEGRGGGANGANDKAWHAIRQCNGAQLKSRKVRDECGEHVMGWHHCQGLRARNSGRTQGGAVSVPTAAWKAEGAGSPGELKSASWLPTERPAEFSSKGIGSAIWHLTSSISSKWSTSAASIPESCCARSAFSAPSGSRLSLYLCIGRSTTTSEHVPSRDLPNAPKEIRRASTSPGSRENKLEATTQGQMGAFLTELEETIEAILLLACHVKKSECDSRKRGSLNEFPNDVARVKES